MPSLLLYSPNHTSFTTPGLPSPESPRPYHTKLSFTRPTTLKRPRLITPESPTADAADAADVRVKRLRTRPTLPTFAPPLTPSLPGAPGMSSTASASSRPRFPLSLDTSAVHSPASPAALVNAYSYATFPRSQKGNTDGSPPRLASPMSLKRANPKRLSLSLSIPPRSATSSTCSDATPYTPGPPKTPAVSRSIGRRPNLLSLITQAPSAYTPSEGHSRSSSIDSTPYCDGPIELIPGVYLGTEESVFDWTRWATDRVRILNVAQEVDDPWADRKGKGKVNLATYPPLHDRPEVEYCHLSWGHGEAGLAEVDASAQLSDIWEKDVAVSEKWRFWEAIQWVEQGRRNNQAVLIHCQCGVSRSATFAIAYIMALAAAGILPAQLGHLKGMQDTYDYVKSKSCWIGPNVSLVFQLVEFSRVLTTLLSAHLATGAQLETSFPTALQVQQTEADWARKRVEFEALNKIDEGFVTSPLEKMSLAEVGEMKREADELDEAMRVRRRERV